MLLDLHYKYPKNTFEEFYGYSIKYSEIEQFSYIDLKDMVFEMINEKIRFRKFGREKGILTVKMDVSESELEKFMSILKLEEFNFLHDFIVTNVRDLTNKERIRFKKAIVESEDEEDSDLENNDESEENNNNQ